MTKQEFDNTRWTAGMKCLVDGETYPIVKVDWDYQTIGIEDEDGEMLEVPYKFVTIK